MLLHGIASFETRQTRHTRVLLQLSGGQSKTCEISYTRTGTYSTLSGCRACDVLVKHEHLVTGLTENALFGAIVVVSEKEWMRAGRDTGENFSKFSLSSFILTLG